MDIGKVLKDSWGLFVVDVGPLIVGAIIAMLLSMVTIGILGPVLFAGLYKMIIRRVREGHKAEIGDIFACFDQFGQLFLAGVVMLLIVLVFVALIALPVIPLVISANDDNGGAVALWVILISLIVLVEIVIGIYLQTIWIYIWNLIVDRRIGIFAAMRESKNLVMANGFWMHLLVIIIVGAISGAVSGVANGIGSFTFGIGSMLSIVVTPWVAAAYSGMYFQVTGEGQLLPSALPPGYQYEGGGAAQPAGAWAGPGGQPPAGPPPGAGWQAQPPAAPPPPPGPSSVQSWDGPPGPPPAGGGAAPTPPAPEPPSPPQPPATGGDA